MNSGRGSSCTSACSTRSNGVCMQVWSLSSSDTGVIGKSRSFLGSILIPLPEAESSCWPGTWSGSGSASREQGANLWKKNARSDRAHRKVAGIRDRRRSDDAVEMDPQNACASIAQELRSVWHSGERQHRGAVAARRCTTRCAPTARRSPSTSAPDRNEQMLHIARTRKRFTPSRESSRQR